jgi:hypothetical protein
MRVGGSGHRLAVPASPSLSRLFRLIFISDGDLMLPSFGSLRRHERSWFRVKGCPLNHRRNRCERIIPGGMFQRPRRRMKINGGSRNSIERHLAI